ncbi:conserved hypothetical protein [Ricinus communis]|uniref:Uncharacterized protein n=1 Tax=Ricinus communis TaxID=3988 RepID=B9S4X0_RICCO|nr:conserved hypothetical protein [Ricinus communis]
MVVQQARKGQSSRLAISFEPTDWESRENYNDPLIIQAYLERTTVWKLLVDGKSIINFLTLSVFRKMGGSITDLIPTTVSLVGLGGKQMQPMGTVDLLIKIEDENG